LYADHVAEPDGPALQQASGELQRLMSGMAASAESTGSQAGVFGAQLVGLSTALRGGDVASLGPMIDGAIAGTADMKDTVLALRQQIASADHRRKIVSDCCGESARLSARRPMAAVL
jgi:hypothetical protein